MGFPFMISQGNRPYWLQFLYAGQVFALYHRFTIPTGGTYYIQLKTPSNPRLIHIIARQVNLFGGTPVVLNILEDPTVTDGTTPPDSIFNLDRRSQKQTDLEAYINPTDVSGGTLTVRDVFFASTPRGSATLQSQVFEVVLRPESDTIYSFTNEANSETDVVLSIQWYESDN